MIDSGRIFPYKTFPELVVRPDAVNIVLSSGKKVSAKARPAVATDANEYHLYADEELAGWCGLEIGVRVLAQQSAIDALVPAHTKLEGNTAMLLAVNCIQTKVRRRVFLTKDDERQGEWYGQLDLAAEDLSGTVELTPMLARVTRFPDAAADDDGIPLGTFPGAILAFGDSITLLVDPKKDERGGTLRVTWEDFTHSSNEWRKTHANDMFYIDTSDESPQVLLNERFDLLKQTLMKKRPKGAEAGLKASIIAYIAHTTWSTLFLAAIADCFDEDASDGDEVSWPTEEVKAKVLKKLLAAIIPERTDDDERLKLAVELYRDPSRFGSLLTKVHSAIQGLIKVDDFVIRTLEVLNGESEDAS